MQNVSHNSDFFLAILRLFLTFWHILRKKIISCWTRASGGNLARTPGLHPTLYDEFHGIFNDRESGPQFNVSYERRCFLTVVSPSLHWGVRTHTHHRVSTPAGLTNTSSSSNLVFTGGVPSRYWPAQPCLASVGDRSWAAGWYGCGLFWEVWAYISQFCFFTTQ